MGFGKKSEPLWRQAFVGVIKQVLAKKDELPFEESCEALRNMHGAELLEFDQRTRWSFSAMVSQIGARSSAVLRMALDEEDHPDILLFYGSCDGNGYIREQALRALRGHGGKLACAAALIRSEDWVPQVGEIASRLLQDLADGSNGKHFFEILDLIAILQSRQRFKQQWQTLEPILLDLKWRDARIEAQSSPKAIARRLAHDLALRADPDTGRDSLRVAISDATPMVALWALAQIRDAARVEDQGELLQEGLRSALATVRADSLRRYCRGKFNDLRAHLEAAVLDRSPSVRRVAAYHLKERYGESALERWRKAFDSDPNAAAMITAISDFAEAADETRLRKALHHSRGRVRALALRGLMRLGTPDLDAVLAEALADKSGHVVGAAVAAYARGIGDLNIGKLQHVLANSGAQSMRSRLIDASRYLLKWDRLEFLLTQYRTCSAEEMEHLDEAVKAWIAKANRSFTIPQSNQTNAIIVALETARKMHPARHWEKLSQML